MADDCTIPRAAVLALRDRLRERATRARKWFDELTTMDPEPLNEYEARERVAALGLFLFEIAGDLEQMQKSLGAILKENA
jgi:hypothetical protein